MNTPCPMCDGMCCRTDIHRIPTAHASEGSHVCPGCQNGMAPLIDFKRLKAMFNELDTLHTEIGYALEGKEVPRGKDELLDRVIELANARHLDNEDLARAYEMGKENERKAIVEWFNDYSENRHPISLGLTLIANAIERGEHLRSENPTEPELASLRLAALLDAERENTALRAEVERLRGLVRQHE